MPPSQTRTARHDRARLALAALALALAALLAHPAAALANSGTLTWGEGNVESFDNVSALMSRAKAVGGDVSISLSDDWFIKDARLEVPEGRNYTFYLNGHMINRQKAGSFGSQWWGEGDCQVFWVGKGASLGIDGGDKTVEHPGTLSDPHEDASGNTKYYFWSYDENGADVLTGGLITGGACDDSDGAGGISLAGDGASCTLRDVTVAGNLVDEYNFIVDYYGYGGGVALHGDSCRLTLYGSKIVYNHAEDSGGGVYVSGDGCTLEASLGSEISHNYAYGGGGGVYVTGESCAIRFDNVKVNDNKTSTERAGGIVISGANADCSLTNCEVCRNQGHSGGGINFSPKGGSITLDSCRVNDNTTDIYGGAFMTSGTSINTSTTVRVTIKDSEIIGNSARRGGGIYLTPNPKSFYELRISGSTIADNTAIEHGGGMFVSQDGTLSITITLSNGTTVKNNSAGVGGGGIYCNIYGSVPDRSFSLTSPDNSTRVEGNKAANGGGLYCMTFFGTIAGLTVSGNEASDTGGGIYLHLAGDYPIDFTDVTVRGNTAGNAGAGISIEPTTGRNWVFEGTDLNLGGTVNVTGNRTGGTIASDGAVTGGTEDNLSLPTNKGGDDKAFIKVSSQGLSTASRVGITVRGFNESTSGQALTGDAATGWADAYNGYMLKSDDTALSVRPSEGGGQLRLFSEPTRVTVRVYGADDSPAVTDRWESGRTATYASADFTRNGQEPVYWTAEGLGDVEELEVADGQVSFVVPENDVALRAQYLPEASGLALGLRDYSAWGALGKNAKLAAVESLSVTGSDGAARGVTGAAVERVAVEDAADGTSKTVTYTVRLGARDLERAGVYLAEGTPEVDAEVHAARACGAAGVSASRDGDDLVLGVTVTCSRLDWLGEWEWDEPGAVACVTRYNGTAADVTVPRVLDGRVVTQVAAGAFAGNATVERVELPSGLDTLGEGAFRGCSSLAEVRVAAALAQIGEGAFEGCAQGLALHGPRACPAQAWAAANGVAYVPDTVLVTLDAADGTQPAAQELAYGARAERPQDPEREGYRFLGWYAEGAGGAWDFSQAVTADLALRARWVPTSFVDVPEGAWFHPWVTLAAQQGLMSGYQDGSGAWTGYFGPEEHITRGQVATVLWRMSGSPAPAGEAPFPDVEADAFYSQAVAWCAERGIVTGYEAGPNKGLFLPKADVSREELAVMVCRWAAWAGVDTSDADEAAFARCIDAQRVSGWSRASMVWCAAWGVLTGKDTPEGLRLDAFQPTQRAQAAKVFVVARAVAAGEASPVVTADATQQAGGAAGGAEFADAQGEAASGEATFDEVSGAEGAGESAGTDGASDTAGTDGAAGATDSAGEQDAEFAGTGTDAAEAEGDAAGASEAAAADAEAALDQPAPGAGFAAAEAPSSPAE